MPDIYDIAAYDFALPEELIAQRPVARRDASRLLRVDCGSGALTESAFAGVIDLLRRGDVLVVNDTRVFPARLLGRKDTGGRAELLLLGYPDGRGEAEVEGLVKSSRRPRPGSRIVFGPELEAEITALGEGGAVRAVLRWQGGLDQALARYGRMPLPPYIRRSAPEDEDRTRYQTVYARHDGAVAAPTAGLHFTPALMEEAAALGVETVRVTLHVGYATFAPVRVRDIRDHRIHSEFVQVTDAAAARITAARAAGGRIWAVGTTAARSLEFAATGRGGVRPVAGPCRLYIYPGYEYQVVDNLITNFHLPKSSLLFMVAAFAGYDTIMAAYRHAVHNRFRFFSYGDAMALVRVP